MFHWTIVYTTLGLYRPNNALHVFSSWLRGVNKKTKQQTLVGLQACNYICWYVWHYLKRHYGNIWLNF
jgi:hypothetical protein